MKPTDVQSFATPQHLHDWLDKNHATQTELWVRMFKKGSGTPSVDWNDCVLACLCWGWIDGQRQTWDAVSFVQRLTPRRAKSSWSQKNCAHAERLVAEGRMQPAGLLQIEAAKKDGRWGSAYAGSAEMEIPGDFLAALEDNPAAQAFYATLNRANLFAIYHRIVSTKTPEMRARKIDSIVLQLAENRRFH